MPYTMDALQDELDYLPPSRRRRPEDILGEPGAEDYTPTPRPTVQETPAAVTTSHPDAERPALSAEQEHLRNRPTLADQPKPKWYNRLGAAVAGAGIGYLQSLGRDVSPEVQSLPGNILRPGYERKTREWADQQAGLHAASALEERQTEASMKGEEHKARLGESAAQISAARAREAYYNRPQLPKPLTPSNTYEEHLVRIIEDPNSLPDEVTKAKEALDRLKEKPERTNAHEQEYESLVKRFREDGKDEATARKAAARLMIRKAEKESTHAPSTVATTLDYRGKQEKARTLAGQAQRQFPNDKTKAREWIARQETDPEIVSMAMNEIGNPPTQRPGRGRAGLLDRLGGSSSSPSDPAGIR